MAVEALGRAVPRIAGSAWIHPTATVIGDVVIGEQASVWPGAVLRGDFGPIRVGERTSVQDNAVVHASAAGASIGSDSVIAHLAYVEDATVGEACLVAAGARVLPGACMRDGSAAAAGAVLAGRLEVPTDTRAQGVPARVVPAPGIRDEMLEGARRYVAMARRHREDAARVTDGSASHLIP